MPSAGGVGFVQDVVEDATEPLGLGLWREPTLAENGKRKGGASGRRSGLGMGLQRVPQSLFGQGVQGDAPLMGDALRANEKAVFDVEGDLHGALRVIHASHTGELF